MICYRIAPKVHNDLTNALSGLGGLYAQGRWHFVGKPIVYTASSRSLAMLERLVNDTTDILSKNLSITTIQIPDDLKVIRFVASELPKAWDDHPYIADTQALGSNWLASMEAAVLQVPSSLCPDEYNFLINPLHKDISRIQSIDCQNFLYPNRLAAKL
ncbi:RES family NAD+ phosphorylase [Pseudoalteromonas sp. 68 DY56-GL68]|uniref:RES family NAD+ phosphorylase n=1 Tax=Pseudoalteromonas sp. 68 DY56-GL68 TaxID=2974919 RepID=UPI003529FB88